MAKQIVAAMLVNHDGVKYQIDDVLDPQLFTKDQLTRLYERGAVKIVDESETKKAQADKAAAFEDMMSKTKSEEQAAAEAAERKKLEEANAARKAELEKEAADAKAKAEAAAKAAAAKVK